MTTRTPAGELDLDTVQRAVRSRGEIDARLGAAGMAGTARPPRVQMAFLHGLVLFFVALDASGQQYNSDNQWTAPHGVATLVGTVGEEYSTFIGVVALLPDWEFNAGFTRYYAGSEGLTEAHTSGTLYVKHRLFENEQETGGLAVMGGTGVDPSHLEAGEVTDTFRSWWGSLAYTLPFRDGAVTWDLLPGFLVNLDKDQGGLTAWGMTYSSRVAIYRVIPHSAIVAEVFGTTGEAYSSPRYRAGIRWESRKLIIAGTYSEAFDGSGGAGFELGAMYLTNPRFCFHGCKRSRSQGNR